MSVFSSPDGIGDVLTGVTSRISWGRTVAISVGDIMSGIDKLARELQKTLTQQDYETITEQLSQGRPQLDNLARDTPILQGTPLTLIVTLIVVWIGARAKRKGGDGSKQA